MYAFNSSLILFEPYHVIPTQIIEFPEHASLYASYTTYHTTGYFVRKRLSFPTSSIGSVSNGRLEINY